MKLRSKAIVAAVIVLLAALAWMKLSRERIPDEHAWNLAQAGQVKMGLRMAERLPEEFYIFEQLQRIRRYNFDPLWMEDKYILKDSASGRSYDPYPQTAKPGRFRKEKLLHPNVDNFGLFLIDLPADAMYMYERDMLCNLNLYELNGYRLALKDGGFQFQEAGQSDREITLKSIRLKNAAVRYNHSMNLHWFPDIALSEATLGGYGYIMRKRGTSFFPMSLRTGKEMRLPARRVFIAHALDRLNNTQKHHDKDYLTKKAYGRARGYLGDDPIFTALVAKELLDLYGAKIRWNEAAQQYEIEQ